MNIRTLTGGVLLALSLLGTAQAKDPSKITDLRYTIRTDYSRIKVRVEGPVRYVSSRSESEVVVVFYDTKLGSPPGAMKWNFQSGLVKIAQFTRLPGDSVRLYISLRRPSEFVMTQNPDDGSFNIDALEPHTSAIPKAISQSGTTTGNGVAPVTRQAPAQQIAKKPAVRQTPVTAKKSDATAANPSSRTAKKTNVAADRSKNGKKNRMNQQPAQRPVVDIAAVALEQTRTSNETEQQSDTAAAGFGWFALIVAVVGAGAGTAVVFAMLRRNMQPAPAAPVRPMPVAAAMPVHVAPNPPAHTIRLENPRPARHTVEEEELESALPPAMGMRTGRAEAELAFRLQTRKKMAKREETLKRQLKPDASNTVKTQVAKKLGIGKGEVDLALQLKKFAQAKATPEEQ